jgi:hypothetical protein
MPVLNAADKLYLGNTVVNAAYVGVNKAWSPFAPPSIAGLTLWLDASTLALANGADVWTWPDLSGHADVAARPGQDNPPSFAATGANGKPAVHFDNPNSEWLFSSTSIGAVGHVFAVTRYNGATFASYDGLLTGSVELILVGELGTNRFYPATGGGTYYTNGVDTTSTRVAPMNGVLSIVGLALATPPTTVKPIVGNDRYVVPRFWDGDIAELITYDHALSTAERQQVEGYLRTKWGL